MKKKDYNISNTINDLYLENFIVNIEYLLKLEQLIEFKKQNHLKLSNDEQIFDLFIVKPSFMLKLIERSNNEKI